VIDSKKKIAQTPKKNNTLNNQPQADEESVDISQTIDMNAKKI
jgi:hypothetical protein